MQGDMTFHFVTDGIEAALDRAHQAAGGKDVRVGGGVSTIRQYLQAGLVDEMHLAIAPVLLGASEALHTGIDLPALGFKCTEHVPFSKTYAKLTLVNFCCSVPASSGPVSSRARARNQSRPLHRPLRWNSSPCSSG
jgi:dihydrofolate reductase